MQIKTGRQFRSYVISWFLVLVGVIVVLGGVSIYRQAQAYLLENLKQNKSEQIQSMAWLIDGDRHRLLTNARTMNTPVYKYLLQVFSQFSASHHQEQLYSLNYDSSQQAFKTAIDSRKALFDLIQITSPLFEILVTNDQSDQVKLYSFGKYFDELKFKSEGQFFHAKLINKQQKTLLTINDKSILTIDNKPLLKAYYKKIWLSKDKTTSQTAKIDLGKPVDFQYRFVKKESLLNLPGKTYVISKSVLQQLQSSLSKDDPITIKENENSNLLIISPIKTQKNKVSSLLVLEVKAAYIEKMADDFLQVVLLSFCLLSICLLIAAIYFARKITDPLEQLTKAISRLIQEDFNFKLSTKGFGSFGFIAQQFNMMLSRIQASRKDLIKMNKAYSRFVPHQLLKQLSASGVNDISLGDCCEREMTVLFCDIRGFTTLSETMSPQANFLFINRYLSQIAPVINRNGGIIDKYLGDGIMALFPNGADPALRAANEMLVALESYNKKLRHKNLPTIEVGLGLHSGKMMLGTVGTQSRMDATVVSDTVNAAARVESMTKVFCTKILITEETKKQLKNIADYKIRFIASCFIQGKSKPVTLYEVFDTDSVSLQKEKLANQACMIQAWKTYKNGDRIMAILMYQKLLEKSSSDKSLFALIECCEKARL
ncbi:adenylate/guanylate cyclase domain-containing protein [Aliikangiella sp. IMCC44359]|uniref:adenylate/guanylate cyclase domain-containing protein n=1 Tax=Aliikangiella sp. IMCC44359 TaxID=3459125 RepID=UPI00403AB77A